MRPLRPSLAVLAGCSLLTPLDSLRGSGDASIDGTSFDGGSSAFDCDASGLVAYWAMNEGHDLVVQDCKGSTPGELVGASQAIGWANDSPALGDASSAVHFIDGGSVQFPTNGSALQIVGPFTVTLWMKADLSTGPAAQDLAVRYTVGAGAWGVGIEQTTWKFYFSAFTSSGQDIEMFSTSAFMPPQSWHQVAVTFDTANNTFTGTLYVDAVVEASQAFTQNIPTNQTPMQLGVSLAGNTTYHGLMANVGFYSRVLSLEEIATLFANKQ
jgi:Concanavalin A-like lectin/glucanases superfamily